MRGNRYMPKPYRCNVCFHSFETLKQAEAHWFATHERDSDGTATAAINEDLSVPKDCQARAESIAPTPPETPERKVHDQQ